MIQEASILKRLMACHNISRLANDFFLTEIGKADFPQKPILNNMYQCCVCTAGQSESMVNLCKITQIPGTISVTLPSQFVEITSVSDDFNGILIAISQEFFNSFGFPYSFKTANVIAINPVATMSDKEFEAILQYCQMVTRILERQRPHVREILRHLTAAIIYSMADNIISTLPPNMTREEAISQQYIELVSKNYHIKKKVTEYAVSLGLTAGYLSSIVKAVSGKSAAEWIDEYIIMESKTLLASTDLTVQQICHRLNFPSQSFFGKYFKRHTGMSPTQYRQSM